MYDISIAVYECFGSFFDFLLISFTFFISN